MSRPLLCLNTFAMPQVGAISRNFWWPLCTADMVARHNRILAEFGITREQAPNIEVLSNFDIVIRLQQNPAGAAPVPVLPGGQEDRDGGIE